MKVAVNAEHDELSETAQLILAGLTEQTQRALSLFGVLNGRQTASTVFSGLEQGNLRLYGVAPRLSRRDFEQNVALLLRSGDVRQTEAGLKLTPQGVITRAADLPLSAALSKYRPDYGAQAFLPQLYLAVQTLSEMSYGNHRYRPAVADLHVQARVRWWYGQLGQETATTIRELRQLFTALDQRTADILAGQFLGHDYSGNPDASASELTMMLACCALLAEVSRAQSPHWYQLWGGRQNMLTQPMQTSVSEFNAGASVEQVAQYRHLRLSTVNEHLQVAAIFGAPLMFARFYPAPVKTELLANWQAGRRTYRELLDALPDLEFMQVRMFQIEQLRGESHAS